MKALIVKKALHTWRNQFITSVQLLLPVLFSILGMEAGESRLEVKPQELPINLDMEPFGRTFIPVTTGPNPTKYQRDFIALYKAQFGDSHYLEEFSIPPYDFNSYALKRAADLGTTAYNKKVIIGMQAIPPRGNEKSAALGFYNGQTFHGKGI
ncbi:hypothetical protein EGW08_008402, partial [Elysia chlorotica]